MNIDLLITKAGDIGLVGDRKLSGTVAGVFYDAETRQVSLEYTDMAMMELNIPVEDDISQRLESVFFVQIGVITNGTIQENRNVPLYLLNDQSYEQARPSRPPQSVTAFEKFLKSCIAGQPVHREDLGAENDTASIMSGINRAVLQFAPHLARQKTLEAQNTLDMSGPSAPSMGGMGGGGGRRTIPSRHNTTDTPPRRPDDEDDRG